MRKGMDAVRIAVATTLCACVIAGCSDMHGLPRLTLTYPEKPVEKTEETEAKNAPTAPMKTVEKGIERSNKTTSASRNPTDKETAAGKERVLEAVEEFLRRTEQYDKPNRLASAGTMNKHPATKSQPDSMTATAVRLGQKSNSTARPVPVPRVLEVVELPSDDGAVTNGGIALAEDNAPNRTGIPIVESVRVVTSHPARKRPETAVGQEKAKASPIKVVAQRSAKTVKSTVADQGTAEPREINQRDLLEFLADELEGDADVAGAWRLRLARLALDDFDGKDEAEDLPEETRRILDAVTEVVEKARRITENPVRQPNEVLDSASRLVRILAERSDPTVPKIALCSEVVTFGVYKELAELELVAGKSIPSIVYIEIANFRSEPTGEGDYKTELATRLELMTADGESVWKHEEPEIIDRCRRYRNDFFVAQRVTIPPTLHAGDYVLKVMVEDKISGRASEGHQRFKLQSRDPVVLRD